MQTLTLIDDNKQGPFPMFRCGECGDLIVFASMAMGDNYSKATMIGTILQQKPRFCPMCGAKNKAGS